MTQDEAAIRNLVARYADAVNRRDEADWAATWAPDAVWDLAGQVTAGREQVVALWRTLLSGVPWVVQLVHSGSVAVDGARATGRWYFSELQRSADGTAGLIVAVYHDACVLGEDGWCFAKRRFDVLYAGPPDLSGHALPFPKR